MTNHVRTRDIPANVLKKRGVDADANPRQELENTIRDAHAILATASTVFPLTLFPNTITIDRAKITVTRRTFFQTAVVQTIRIEDVLSIDANVGPILGSVKIMSQWWNEELPQLSVDKLWREDAERIKRIGQGYVIALKKDIDCASLSTEELAHMLDKIGVDDHSGAK